ncbi:hypothetical protein BC828DRAFT_65260 [Blastocladiella britannica]|nr:hypothetical protein BC828DRAFT_65260 [Blastocladiella britannica]
MYPLHENSGDSNFLMGYACAYTMVVGLHRLAATAGTSITAVASHDPATWSHMSLSLFNLTAAVFPRPRDMITLDSNGDGIAGPMAMTQYAFNRDPTNSSVITALDPVNCDVYPFEMRLTYASSLVPCVFPGMRTGEIPSDTPTVATVTLINPRVGDSAGNAILSLCGSALALLLISCTGMVHFRKHPALSLTPWPGIVAMHLIAAATPVSAFLDLFPLTPLICSSQMTLTAAPVTCTLVVFYVQAKAVAQAIECQHRIPTEQGRIVASPSSLSVPSFGFTRSIMSATRSIRPISKTALSQESVVPPRTPQQELLYHFAAVDGSQGVTPYLRAMVQHGFPIFIVYMTLLSISIGLCQPTTSMVSLSATTANMSCTCKNGERIYWQTSVYLAHTVFMFLVARLVYQHRSVHFNNKLMRALRIGASIVNMVIFVGLILVFYYFPSTAWLYVFMAFLRIYCGISTVGIYLIPLCVNIYTSSKAEVFTATSSNDSLYECVQQIRSELENERRPSVIPKSVPDGDGDATIAAVAAAPRAPLSRKISGMSVRIGVPATVMTSRLALASPTAAAAPSNANTVRSQQQLVLTSVDGGPSGDPLIAVEEMPAEEAASTSTGTVYFNVKVSAALPAASQLLLSLRDPIWHAFRSYAGNGLLGAITPRLRALSSRSRDPQRRWSNAYVVVVGGPTRAEMRLIYIGEQPNGDGDRIAGPPESFDLVLYSESQSKSSPLTPQSEVSNSSSTTLLGLLHCRESHRFVALKFASKDQLQEFCLIVPPRAAHEQGSMMSIF